MGLIESQSILVEPFDFVVSATDYPVLSTPPSIYSSGAANGLANLLTDDPREVWRPPYVNLNYNLYIDLGADRLWDTIALINTNASPATNWFITQGTAAQNNYFASVVLNGTTMRTPTEDVADSNGPAFYWTPATRLSRYIAVQLQLPASVPLQTVGRLVVGKSYKPALPRELGGGRVPVDTGVRSRADDGGLGTESGALRSGFRWTYGDLDDSDLAKLWGILRRRRTTEPLLFIENPETPVAEGVHYGTMIDIEGYERREPGKSRWSLNFDDWL